MTFDEFRHLLSENFGVDEDLIKRDTSLIYDLGIDSLSIINFIIKLEKKYNIKYNIENVWSLKNVEEAYNLLICNFKL